MRMRSTHWFIRFLIEHIIHQEDERIGVPEITLDQGTGNMALSEKTGVAPRFIFSYKSSFV
jgi:hypothetical protein